MKNEIEKVRAEIKRYFDPLSRSEGPTVEFSPDNKFRLEWERYRQNKPDLNWYVTKVQILDNVSNEKLFEFFTDDTCFFHSWLKVRDIDYFVCAENMCGGQTVIDITNKLMASYADGTDGFIWTELFLAPDANTLAAIGCFWACPYEIKIYDFSVPMNLPLKELKSVELIGSETIVDWPDNRSFRTYGLDSEYIEEYLNDGSFTSKATGVQKVIERVISIDS